MPSWHGFYTRTATFTPCAFHAFYSLHAGTFLHFYHFPKTSALFAMPDSCALCHHFQHFPFSLLPPPSPSPSVSFFSANGTAWADRTGTWRTLLTFLATLELSLHFSLKRIIAIMAWFVENTLYSRNFSSWWAHFWTSTFIVLVADLDRTISLPTGVLGRHGGVHLYTIQDDDKHFIACWYGGRTRQDRTTWRTRPIQ